MIKNLLRKFLLLLPIKITQNLQYDRLTRKIIQSHLSSTSNAIDVGCHKGEVMDIFLKHAPQGKHIGIEPIPSLAEKLRRKYKDTQVKIHEGALSDYTGNSAFNLVTTNPAYSGLKKRKYDRKEKDKSIEITVSTLDNIVSSTLEIAIIKIDVEGGELGVMKGGFETLRKWHPLIIFEHGKGAADYYNYGPKEVFEFLSKLKYNLYTLDGYTSAEDPLTFEKFDTLYNEGIEYYFIAY